MREVREETGFEVEVEPLDFRYDLQRSEEAVELWARLYGPEIETVPEECFGANVAPGSEPQLTPLEHDAFRWCSFEEADVLLKWEENRLALRILRVRLGG